MIEVFGEKVVAIDLEHGERKTASGIVLRDDDGKTHGIRPRWAKVYCKGEKATQVEEGQWILIEHGRWSHKFKEKDENGELRDFWLIDYRGIWGVSDELPETMVVNDSY